MAIVCWTAGVCIPMFGLLKYFQLLRVDRAVEIKGLDLIDFYATINTCRWSELFETSKGNATPHQLPS